MKKRFICLAVCMIMIVALSLPALANPGLPSPGSIGLESLVLSGNSLESLNLSGAGSPGLKSLDLSGAGSPGLKSLDLSGAGSPGRESLVLPNSGSLDHPVSGCEDTIGTIQPLSPLGG